LYDAIRPRGAAPGDRFASLGYGTGPVEDLAWLGRLGSQVALQGEGKGPRHALLVALPRSVADPRGAEMALEDALEDGVLPYHVNESATCCMAPGEDACAVLLQSGFAASRAVVLAGLAESDDYFSARDDK
jgi:hypothetical protein